MILKCFKYWNLLVIIDTYTWYSLFRILLKVSAFPRFFNLEARNFPCVMHCRLRGTGERVHLCVSAFNNSTSCLANLSSFTLNLASFRILFSYYNKKNFRLFWTGNRNGVIVNSVFCWLWDFLHNLKVSLFQTNRVLTMWEMEIPLITSGWLDLNCFCGEPNIIITYIFPENFIDIYHVVLRIWRFSS